MPEDNGLYSAIQQAQSTANEAFSLAREALNLAENVARRQDVLEERVDNLMRLLEQQLDALISETRRIQEVLESQGEAIQRSVQEGSTQVSNTVQSGFTAMSQQECEARLLDSRTELIGLVSRLTMTKNTLQSEYNQALRRGESQKIRFSKAFERTVESLNRDVERVGSRILEIQRKDFGPTVEDRMRALRSMPNAFELAVKVGKLNLLERSSAIKPHLDKLNLDLEGFAEKRNNILKDVVEFIHDRLALEPGGYAVRNYYFADDASEEVLIGADVRAESGRVAINRVKVGMAKLDDTIMKLWRTEGNTINRPMIPEERNRLNAYLSDFQKRGLLTAQELGVILRHLEKQPIEIVETARRDARCL